MRIAYILSSLANSGPIIVAYDLVQLMIRNGHSVEVFYFDDKTDLDFHCATPVTVYDKAIFCWISCC